MPVCRTRDPRLLESEPGHEAACHLPVEDKRQTWSEVRPRKAVAA